MPGFAIDKCSPRYSFLMSKLVNLHHVGGPGKGSCAEEDDGDIAGIHEAFLFKHVESLLEHIVDPLKMLCEDGRYPPWQGELTIDALVGG